MTSITAVFGALAVAWTCWAWITSTKRGIIFSNLKPPPPNTCGSPGGPPVTSQRIRLRDGRYLAYKEFGVPRQQARHHVIAVHGFGASKDGALPPLSPELVDELGVCVLSYDRAGYGESDPNPGRTGRDEALDVQDLAEALLGVGARFYLVGVSMGGYVAWACIKQIPHRLAGVALVAPAVNFWWPSFPQALASSAFRKLTLRDRITFSIARHSPALLYAWMTQRVVTPSAIATPVNGQPNPAILSRSDAETFRKMKQSHQDANPIGAGDGDNNTRADTVLQQGVWESIHRDMVMLFADREFDPMEMGDQDPLLLTSAAGGSGAAPSSTTGGVHVWQGGEDRIVPAELQRYVPGKLPWVRYHEFPELGHMFLMEPGWPDLIVKTLLVDRHGQ